MGYFVYLCPDMAKGNQYVFNKTTLSYEVKKRSGLVRLAHLLPFFCGSIALAMLYMWIYTSVLGFELPKTMLLKKENAQWRSKVEVMNTKLDEYDRALVTLQHRDNGIYRSIFGMNEIPSEVRNAGFGGVNRYSHFDDVDSDGLLKKAAVRLDVLSKKTCVQSKSFDEISQLSRRAGEMASCIPAIPPMCPDRERFRVSSSFGYRSDPFSKRTTRHTGVDFAMKSGNLLYATGDGVVESVKFELWGYGNQVVIDHGFGYKTRYAHMSTIAVAEGMKIKRGECIGLSGNSGKSSGPHLHYEVIYKGAHVNPANYYDLDITVDEYETMVQDIADASQIVTLHPSHQKKRK
jgi:murein DD-endopeptidase MepM/ murein hydrolase activator NlpD